MVIPRCYINGTIDRCIHNRTDDTEESDAVGDRRYTRVDAARSHNVTRGTSSRGNGFFGRGNAREDKEQGAHSAHTKQFLGHSILLKIGFGFLAAGTAPPKLPYYSILPNRKSQLSPHFFSTLLGFWEESCRKFPKFVIFHSGFHPLLQSPENMIQRF